MLKKAFLVVLVVLMTASLGYSMEVAGINLPDSISAADSTLALNGAGTRTKLFIDVYVGGLYLQNKSNNAQSILNADEPMAVRLHITSGLVTSEKLESAIREGFDCSTKGNIEPMRDEIENFISVFKEKVNENDIYDFVYSSDKGVEIFKNGKLSSTTPGLEFKKALFGIWLSDKPAQKSLKNQMLGI